MTLYFLHTEDRHLVLSSVLMYFYCFLSKKIKSDTSYNNARAHAYFN
nr:MAG TPA: hypothetical protein [Caudoviricetes sp.]